MTLTMNVELPDTFSSELKHLLEALLQVKKACAVHLFSYFLSHTFPLYHSYVVCFGVFPPPPPPTPLRGAAARCDLYVFLQVQGREGGEYCFHRTQTPLVLLTCTLRFCIIKFCRFVFGTYFSLSWGQYGVPLRVGNFRSKNNSAEDGIVGTNGYFQRNSGCSAEQKTSEFRSEPFRGRENNSEFRSVEQK
jgi:hypothetical protein